MPINRIETLQETLQNVYTPFPLIAHLIFVAAAVMIFFIQFYRKGGVHYLLMVAATASTLITQMPGFSESRKLIFILEVEEVVLCIGIIFFVILSAVKRRKLKAASESAKQEREIRLEEQAELKAQEKKLHEIEKIEDEINENPVENAFENTDSDLDIYL